MQKMKYIFITILSVFLFSSCEKKANIEIPNQDPELVVAGFIGPNEDTTRLKLTWTVPIYNHTYDEYDDNSRNEKDAEVSFVSNGNTIMLQYNNHCNCYITTNNTLKVGDEVSLSIKYKDHAELTSKAIIPKDPEFDIKFQGIKSIDYGDYSESYAEFKFTCLSDEPINYYRIKMLSYSHQGNYVVIEEMYMYEYEYVKMEPNTSITLSPYYNEYNTLDSVRYYIVNCSEDYYKYHISVHNYQGDDFFVEPSIIYDNIDNGFGNFSAYNMVSDTLITN